MGPGDHRVDLRRLLHPRPHLQRFHRLLEAADQGVKQRRFDVDPRAGGADLPLIEEASGHQPLNNPLGVGVFEHNRRILATQLQRHAGQAVGSHAGNLFPGRRRAGKADLRHLRMGGQRRAAAGAAAGDHVEHPVRNARLGRQLRHPQQGQRGGFRGFDDDRTARRQGRHDLPHADHQREIPRDDARHHPDRLFFGPRLVTRPLRERDRNVQRPAADLGGQPRGVAHPVQGAADLKGAGDGNGFPLLEGFQLRQLFAVLLHQIGKTQQDAFTVSRGAPGPAAIDKSAPGGHHRPVDIRRAGVGGGGNRLPGGRIPDG